MDTNNYSLSNYLFSRISSAFRKCFKSRYFNANCVYLFYCSSKIYINFHSSYIGELRLQSVYIQLTLLHLSIALLYFYMWSGEGYNIFRDWLFLFPDWLNLVGSLMYLVSACMYPYQFSDTGDRTKWFDIGQLVELTAVIIEFVAAICWLIQWSLIFTF